MKTSMAVDDLRQSIRDGDPERVREGLDVLRQAAQDFVSAYENMWAACSIPFRDELNTRYPRLMTDVCDFRNFIATKAKEGDLCQPELDFS